MGLRSSCMSAHSSGKCNQKAPTSHLKWVNNLQNRQKLIPMRAYFQQETTQHEVGWFPLKVNAYEVDCLFDGDQI